MKKILTFYIICIFFNIELAAQGFDWQYSARLPSTSPIFFTGLTGEFNYLLHYGNINLKEGYSDCCSFSSGQGFGSSFGIQTEYWMKGSLAVTAGLTYTTYGGSFAAQGLSLPRIINNRIDTIQFENDFKSNLSYIMLEAGGKYRILLTHLYLGASIKMGMLTGSSVQHTEKVLSPANYRFNDGSQERTINDGKISEIYSFFFTPRVRLGYDLSLGLGMYASPVISVGFPVSNVTSSAEWKTWTLSAGLTIYRGIF